MEEKITTAIPKYFAAANTYRGFVSFFEKVFDSKDYDRIYVLKGGPGTGKSNFMKRASVHFLDKKCHVEDIYCSSDPHSLDGVIISAGDKKVAILDGTAPHERDAIIPGSIDEIINLGEGWDERILVAQRDEILSLVKEKSESYRSAYNYLSVAGKSQEIIDNMYARNFNKSNAKSEAEGFLNEVSGDVEGKIQTRLISSFGRYGDYRLNTLNDLDLKQISVCGKESTCRLFLGCCFDYLKDRKTNIIHLPCALDPRHTDALFLIDHGVAIMQGEGGDINADEFIKLSPADSERIRTASRIHGDALEEAKRWFAIASDLHFRLEEIYGRAMDFDKNNRVLDTKINQIENILEIM